MDRLLVEKPWFGRTDNSSQPRTITISGGRPGSGATTLAVNSAVALASQGLRTVLVDADLHRANVASYCGLPDGQPGIGEVLAGRKGIHETLTRGPSGVQVLVGANTAEVRNNCSEKALGRLLRQLQSLGRFADIVLIDTGDGSSEPAIRLWQAADQVLLVTSPDAVAVMDTYATVKTMLSRLATVEGFHLVVNQADSAASAADVHRRIDQSCRRFLGTAISLGGWLPADPIARCAISSRTPAVLLAPDSALTKALEQLTTLLVSQQEPRLARTA